MNNNMQGRHLALRCHQKSQEIEMESAGVLQTLAVSLSSAVGSLVLQVPIDEELYFEHYVNDAHRACDFIVAKHREQQQLAKEGRCGRCHALIENFRLPEPKGMTAGYYMASGWEKYCNLGEIYVCDECMFSNSQYQEVYGDHRKFKSMES